MKMREFSVTLPCTLQVFAAEQQFHAHARSHFCNPEEPWDRVLSRTLLAKVCQKIDAAGVSLMNTLYERVPDAIRDGVTFSAELPLYAVLTEQVTRGAADARQQDTVYCIAKKGFMIVIVRNIVRTAYFPSCLPHDSAYTLFNKAWKAVKVKCAMQQYIDDKYETVHHRVSVRLERAEHWHRGPNPHARPAAPPSRRPRINAGEDDARWEHRICRYEN